MMAEEKENAARRFSLFQETAKIFRPLYDDGSLNFLLKKIGQCFPPPLVNPAAILP
jgi:hypothetical protein